MTEKSNKAPVQMFRRAKGMIGRRRGFPRLEASALHRRTVSWRRTSSASSSSSSEASNLRSRLARWGSKDPAATATGRSHIYSRMHHVWGWLTYAVNKHGKFSSPGSSVIIGLLVMLVSHDLSNIGCRIKQKWKPEGESSWAGVGECVKDLSNAYQPINANNWTKHTRRMGSGRVIIAWYMLLRTSELVLFHVSKTISHRVE